MKKELTTIQHKQSVQVNRVAYILYLVLVAYLLFKGDFEWAAINMGIAMIFDPFDSNVKWQDRPKYQKAWLLCHLTLTFCGFIYLVLA